MWVSALLCPAAVAFTGCAMDDTTSQVRKFLATEGVPKISCRPTPEKH